MAWLGTQESPPVIRSNAAGGEKAGRIEVSFDRGSLYLVPARSGSAPGPVRMAWDGRAGPRSIPAGAYHLLHYVIERNQGGRTWMFSCTGTEGPRLIVGAGETTHLDLETKARLGWKVERRGDRLSLALGVFGQGGMEASLLDTARKGVDLRVEAGYGILDASGAQIGSGSLSYG